ncbi:leucine-rich repeat domain-containing protein [Treponema phagedenis]|uniref:leucine-rich repeat domain-containing protein n=1 Tax=Treponema phagedenis TaxID=162 RepID=UPI0011E742BE|nr:leucine-rich repeat domain-containing protein [Treponema phagedenis]QEK02645.1 leucine-rich repeat protein [Treponema phagedenis]
MMKNSSIVKKGLMQIHKSLLVAVLAFAALGILGGLTACHEQPITPSGGSSGLTPSTPSKITVTVQGDANVKGVPFTLTATGKKWADIKTDAKAKITFNKGYELDSYRVSTKDGEYITDGYVFTKDTTIFVVSKEAGTPSTPTVTITVKGDSNITAIPKKSLMVTKGERWKTVQAKITVPTSFTPNYEFDKWTLEGKTEAIPDAYEFKDNTIIVAVSKAKGTTPAPTPLKNFITTETNGALTITGYNGEPPAILVIPEKIDGKPVVSIGKKAFMEKTSIQKVIFPKSLKTIENGTRNFNSEKYEGAFSDCTNLTELNFSKCTELTSIGDFAFSCCSGITGELDLSHLTKLEYLSGFNETGITAVKFPANLKTIGEEAFSGCSGITALTLPDSLTTIEIGAFEGCSGITGELDLSHLTKLEYLSGFNETGITAVKFPANLKTIGRHAFFRCSGIRALTLPDSLTSIGWYAFSGCSGITALTLPSKLTSIGDFAFSGCSGITALTLPSKLTSIGDFAFSGCKIKTLEVGMKDISFTAKDVFGNSRTSITTLTLQEGVQTIGRSAFSGCSGIRALTLPDSLTSIGEYAFFDCSGITVLTLPASLTTIEHATFYGCSGITVLTLPDSLTSIGSKAFFGCSSIETLTLPEGLQTIEEKAFEGCSSIETLTLPEGLQTIEEKAFEGCKIETLEVGMKDISFTAEDVFGYSRTSITTLTLQEGVQTIGRSAFSGCSGIRALTLPDSLTSIGWYAFSGCSGITALTLPSKLTSIGDLAFSGCKIKTLEVGMKDISFTAEDVFGDSRTSITTLTLQEGVQTIGGYAFYGCINIGDIDLSKCNQLTTIDEKAFLGCKKATVKLPASITEIKEYAFGAKHAWWINPETNVGEYTESFCKEVQVPGNPGEADYDRISGLVKKNGIYASYSENYYPEDRIQPIPTP